MGNSQIGTACDERLLIDYLANKSLPRDMNNRVSVRTSVRNTANSYLDVDPSTSGARTAHIIVCSLSHFKQTGVLLTQAQPRENSGLSPDSA